MSKSSMNYLPVLTQNLCLDFDGVTHFDKKNGHNSKSNPLSTNSPPLIHPKLNLKDATSFKNSKHITELSVSFNMNKFDDFTLAILAHLSRKPEDRWLTWVTPKKISSTALKRLDDYDFDKYKIRVVNVKSEAQALWVTWDALNNGTSATVVSDLTATSTSAISQLNEAAISGRCEGIILRQSH